VSASCDYTLGAAPKQRAFAIGGEDEVMTFGQRLFNQRDLGGAPRHAVATTR
jgi:hypothetical protein